MKKAFQIFTVAIVLAAGNIQYADDVYADVPETCTQGFWLNMLAGVATGAACAACIFPATSIGACVTCAALIGTDAITMTMTVQSCYERAVEEGLIDDSALSDQASPTGGTPSWFSDGNGLCPGALRAEVRRRVGYACAVNGCQRTVTRYLVYLPGPAWGTCSGSGGGW